MAKKKVILFIVEGPTDETSLSTVLNRIFSSSTVKFQVVHGDILTRDFTSTSKIITAVWDLVKGFMGNIYHKNDICRIVHLTDTDGVFVPDKAIIEDKTLILTIPKHKYAHPNLIVFESVIDANVTTWVSFSLVAISPEYHTACTISL